MTTEQKATLLDLAAKLVTELPDMEFEIANDGLYVIRDGQRVMLIGLGPNGLYDCSDMCPVLS